MSGGVDSTIAAHVLKSQGHEVVGLHLVLGQVGGGDRADDSARDAAQTADALGVRFETVDCRGKLERIVDYFCDAYNRGLTPNPCVRCNAELKFRTLCEFADEIGAQLVATGHYARVVTQGRRRAIARGRDAKKDQSYVLHRLTQPQLERLTLPVGEMTRADVEAAARRLGLDAADRPSSQEVCFAPGGDHTAVLRARCPDALVPGPILDTAGQTLGQHPGIQFFTVGQRRGLGIALGAPRYVVRLDPTEHAVVIGTKDEIEQPEAWVSDVNWMAAVGLDAARRADVQIRYSHAAAPAELEPAGPDRVRVRFDEPQPAVTPGQAAVFYEGDVVLGGGWIERRDAPG